MRVRRWPWPLGAILLFASGAAAAWSTYLHWLPCRGSMLSGSVMRGYAYGPEFSDACLRTMDGGMPFHYLSERSEPVPGAAGWAVAAMLLVALAWLMPVLALRWPIRMKVLLSLPVVANLILALAAGLARGSGAAEWLPLLVDLAAAVALFVVLNEATTRRTWALGLRLMVLLWATTAFGMFHGMFSYASMASVSDANWDVPPGTGYNTAALLVLAAVATVMLTLVLERRPSDVESPAQLATVP